VDAHRIIIIFTGMSSIESAAILAGGKNLRFNRQIKSLAILKGKSLLDHQLMTLNTFFNEILLITNHPEAFNKYDSCRIFRDLIPGRGPLSGIHTALTKASSKNVFIVAGDMPFINLQTIGELIKHWQENQDKAVVPRMGDKPEPLHAIYPGNILESMENWLKHSPDQSVRAFLKHIPVCYRDFSDPTPFININTPQELRRYEAD